MTRRAQEGEAVRKRREIAQNAQKCTHKKRACQNRTNSKKSSKKCNKMQQKKERRTESEQRGISNFATRKHGCWADAPGISKHDTRAADSDISDTLKSRECLSDALYGPWTDFRQSKGEQK